MQRPDRRQVELRSVDLEGLLPADHRARVVWEFVEGLDLAPLYAGIKAVEEHAGRPPIDPAILMALWLYATAEGVGSARAVARLCEEHDAYRWLCGGVSVNYHTLADFRVGHAETLDGLLTTSVAALMAEGLVTLQRVAQDGVKVRASAGAQSFRRGERLAQLLAEATAQVEALKAEVHDDPGATARRVAAARRRAAEERRARVARALERVPAVAARRRKAAVKGPARVSTTDADARVMKMPDDGYRPAYNGQFATTPGSQVIVGVAVPDAGTDLGQLAPMVEQLQRRYGQAPAELLADGGFVALKDVRALGEGGCQVYAPLKAPRGRGRARDRRRRDDAMITAWRARMATEEAKQIYRERAATAECVNALARNRGLRQLVVRGLRKVRAVLLWFALTHNALRAVALRQAVRATA
ncbi:MAG: IS1182 family transposase [Candidatus Rokubacteria bacterium]|nr:IS1182 family transposase [Candidatus Rokubacteria bacterium]